MRLELTSEQYDLIQREVIVLESELSIAFGSPERDGWDIVFLKDRIRDLKQILEDEYIAL
jgi:hypothetical protein